MIRQKNQKSIKYKNQVFEDTPHRRNCHNFQFHFRYIQDITNTKSDQAKRIYCKNISRKLTDESLYPKKCWFFVKTLLNGKRHLLYHQYTISTNLRLTLRQSVSSLIHILKDSACPLSIIASCQQDLQFIPIQF